MYRQKADANLKNMAVCLGPYLGRPEPPDREGAALYAKLFTMFNELLHVKRKKAYNFCLF